MKLLLISASGKPYLGHCRKEMVSFLSPIKELHFISAAAFSDEKAYCQKVVDALVPEGIAVHHLRWDEDPLGTLAKAKALFVGGGNTYLLLNRLTKAGLVGAIREKVLAGMPYIGSSAGTNITGPTILTTNDWNVLGSTDFNSLGLVPFNINPHYLETDLTAAPAAETRDERIQQYHVVNGNAVVAPEETVMIRIEGGLVKSLGTGRVRLFRQGKPPVDYKAGSQLPAIREY
jgi:dipeptidase E